MFDTIAPTYDRANHSSPPASTAAGGTAPPASSAPSSSAPKPSSSTSAAVPATSPSPSTSTAPNPRSRPDPRRRLLPPDALPRRTRIRPAQHRPHRSRRPPSPPRRQLRRPRHLRLRLPQPANYAEGLAELHRVLRPGGQIAILECNQPEGLVGALYSLLPHPPAQSRRPHLRQARRLRLPARLGRALPPPAPHEPTHHQRRLHQRHLDQLHLRHRRPLPRHQTLDPRNFHSSQRGAYRGSLPLLDSINS